MELQKSRHPIQPHLKLSCRHRATGKCCKYHRCPCYSVPCGAPGSTRGWEESKALLIPSTLASDHLRARWQHCRTVSLSVQGQCEVSSGFHHQYYLQGHRVRPCKQHCSGGAASLLTKPTSAPWQKLLIPSRALKPSTSSFLFMSIQHEQAHKKRHISKTHYVKLYQKSGIVISQKVFPLDQEHGGILMILLKITWIGESWKTHPLYVSR